MCNEEEWQRSLQVSASRREREAAKRKQLLAEIAAIDISHRVMKPKQLARCREEIRTRIGVAVPAETQKTW